MDQTNYNWAKNRLIDDLMRLGFLTKKEKQDLQENYAVIFVRKGWFGETVDKILGLTNDSQYQIKLVKINYEDKSEQSHLRSITKLKENPEEEK